MCLSENVLSNLDVLKLYFLAVRPQTSTCIKYLPLSSPFSSLTTLVSPNKPKARENGQVLKEE